MKKILLSLFATIALATSGFAQTWNMVVTREDGTKEVFPASKVKNVSFEMADQNVSQVIIKELYNGGCQPDNGGRSFQMDKGFILYNNGGEVAVINNLAVGIVDPNNSHAPSKWLKNGKLVYDGQGYIPGIHGIWYFQGPLVMQPYSQIVVNVNGAIDNTKTYSKSVNYANKDYYAMYDPESGYNNELYYPSPSELIPTSHYLKAVEYGQGNGWTLSVTSPAMFIFQTQGVTPRNYANNVSNIIYAPGAAVDKVNANLKIPNKWVIDGIEVFSSAYTTKNAKRLSAEIDGGSVLLTYQLGHTLYRNVDKEETEKLPENKGKLVYGYTMGVSTGDPSGIDAEASIKNGAHIIYMDTNNSTNDFHERKAFSIKGK
ncbi:DUF4876 domain-containing protein [Hoylesella loescheii]|uniref:DUF4876 domain-containing protein n=1 Tax=Hoylesella loescheii TaxID=840 RepID=UPI0028E2F5F9|nr:DUF4876 domain-containing protein [Hoylesella loescheii]